MADKDVISEREEHADAIRNEISELFNAGAGTSKFEIYVYELVFDNGKKKEAKLFNIPPDELPFLDQRLLNEFMPLAGQVYNFRARVLEDKNDGEGMKTIRQFDFSIRKPYGAPVVTSGATSDLTAVLKAMQEQQAEFRREVMEMVRDARSQKPEGGMKETLATIAGVAAILKSDTPTTPINGDPMTYYLKGMEFAEKMLEKFGGGGGDSGGFGSIVRDIIPQLPGIIEAGTRAAQLPKQTPNTQPPALPNTQASPSPNTQDDALTVRMKSIMNELVESAKVRNDVELNAEWLLSKIPPHLMEQLLAQPDLLATLRGFDPEVGNYLPWFFSLIEVVRREFYRVDDLTEVRPAPDAATNGNGIAERNSGGNSVPENREETRNDVQEKP